MISLKGGKKYKFLLYILLKEEILSEYNEYICIMIIKFLTK